MCRSDALAPLAGASLNSAPVAIEGEFVAQPVDHRLRTRGWFRGYARSWADTPMYMPMITILITDVKRDGPGDRRARGDCRARASPRRRPGTREANTYTCRAAG